MNQMLFPDPQVSGQRQSSAQPAAEIFHVFEKPLGTLYGGDYGRSMQCPKCGRAACHVITPQGADHYVHVFTIRVSGKGNPLLKKNIYCEVK